MFIRLFINLIYYFIISIEVPSYSNTGSFVEYGVKAWNELPDILRCTTSRTEFKRELKTHLFSPYE